MGPAAPALAEARRHVAAVVRRSGTSFALGMAILPRARREAMYAIYAFCREIDDIADEPGSIASKRAALADWRMEIERVYARCPTTATGTALLEPVSRFCLPRQEFMLLIEGMSWDANGPIVAPSRQRLIDYCRRVAGSVGMLSMPVFGAPSGEASDRFALNMGLGLQLANIVRDVGEDSAEGRLYLPDDLLARFDLPADPAGVVSHPNLPAARAALAVEAQAAFAAALAELRCIPWRRVRPALVMQAVYARMLARLERDGFRTLGKPEIGKVEKLATALAAMLRPPRAA